MSFNPIAASSVYDCKKLLSNNLPKAIEFFLNTLNKKKNF
tara:strand:+ start:228 stop:347 length:120 start_codon:yes stop_codon:yes gene_type:complete